MRYSILPLWITRLPLHSTYKNHRYVDSVAGSQSPSRGHSLDRDRDARGSTPDSPNHSRDRNHLAAALQGPAAASSSSSQSPARRSITPRRHGSVENVRKRQEAIAKEERANGTVASATGADANSSADDRVSTSQPRDNDDDDDVASDLTAASEGGGVGKGRGGEGRGSSERSSQNCRGSFEGEEEEEEEANDLADPSFSAEGPPAVVGASSTADYAAEVATEACAHKEDTVELPDGSVYVGQTRRNARGDVEFHGLGKLILFKYRNDQIAFEL